MKLNRSVVGLFVLACLITMPASASALSFGPAAGSPITNPSPEDVINDVTTGDFNGDNAADIATVGDTKKVSVYLNDNSSQGTFTAAPGSPFQTDAPGGHHFAIYSADVNGDTEEDLLVGKASNRRFETYLGVGDGSFPAIPSSTVIFPDTGGPAQDGFSGSQQSSFGDVNNDELPDLVVGMSQHAIGVALGNSDGSFTVTPASPIDIPIPSDIPDDSPDENRFDQITKTTIGDFNQDGQPDVAMVMRPLIPGHESGIFVANGNGSGGFSPAAGNPLLTGAPFQAINDIKTIRLAGDNHDDVAILHPGNPDPNQYLRTMIGSPAGLVPNPDSSGTLYPGGYPVNELVADVDDNGRQDVVTSLDGTDLGVALGKNDAAGFTIASGSPFDLPPIGGNAFNAATIDVADFNGDDFPDLASSSSHSGDPSQARGIDILLRKTELGASPSTIEFAGTAPGQTSSTEAAQVQNLGGPPIEVTNYSVGDPGNAFSVDASACEVTLAAGEGCDIDVTFEPTAHGIFNGSVTVTFEGGRSVQISLSGKTGDPEATISPVDTWDFGPAVSGYAAGRKTKTFTVTSTGTRPVAISQSAVFPDAPEDTPDDFEILNPTGCIGNLPPNATCQINVAFEPPAGATGDRHAIFVVDADFPDGPLFVELNGEATTAAYSVSPGSLAFDDAEIGAGLTGTRPAKTLKITNTGTGDLPYAGSTITGPDAASFMVADSCPSTFLFGQPCSPRVIFDPKTGSAGARSATLTLKGGINPAGYKTVALSGTATPGAIVPPALDLKLRSAGKVKRGKTLVVKATVTNTGGTTAKSIVIMPGPLPKKFVKSIKPIKITSLDAGTSVTKTFKVKVKKSVKKGKKLKVKVSASATGVATKSASRTVKIR